MMDTGEGAGTKQSFRGSRKVWNIAFPLTSIRMWDSSQHRPLHTRNAMSVERSRCFAGGGLRWLRGDRSSTR